MNQCGRPTPRQPRVSGRRAGRIFLSYVQQNKEQRNGDSKFQIVVTFTAPPSSTAHVWSLPAAMSTTTAPVPRSTAPRLSPMVAALCPRASVSPWPSCPKSFNPKHLRDILQVTTHKHDRLSPQKCVPTQTTPLIGTKTYWRTSMQHQNWALCLPHGRVVQQNASMIHPHREPISEKANVHQHHHRERQSCAGRSHLAGSLSPRAWSAREEVDVERQLPWAQP